MVVVVIVAALAVAGCGASGGSGTTPAPTGATTSTLPTSAQAQAQCLDVVAKGQVLATTVLQFVSGGATQSQVSAAAQDLSAALVTAQAVLAPTVGMYVSNAQADVKRLVDALQAQPVDMAGVRAAANTLAVDLRGLATVCASTTPTAPSTS